MYKISKSDKFEDQLIGLYSSHPRMEELEKAIAWYLIRTPRSLAFDIGGNFFLWITDQLPVKTIPKVKIVYQVNDETQVVKLISIEEYVDQP